MKTVYLVRHAKSSWDDLSLDDYDRPLNKRGKADAPFMGQKMKEMGIKPDLMVSSGAKRAKKTAKAFAEALAYPESMLVIDRAIYDANESDLLAYLQKTGDAHDSVMLFGHNPEFTWLANRLSQAGIDNIPTSGVVCLAFKVEHWADLSYGAGKLLFFDYPKRYK